MAEKNYHSMFQDLLVLLCFSEKCAPILGNSLKLGYFGDPCYREIAAKAIEYYKNYDRVPGKDIFSLVEDVINGKDVSKASRYADTVSKIYANEGAVGEDYTLSRLNDFINRQSLELVFLEGSQLFADGKIDEAAELLKGIKTQKAQIFDPGIRITDVEEVLKAHNKNSSRIKTGIPELDRLGICPTPQEMMVLTAPAGRGKTWFAGSLIKNAHLDFKPDGGRYKSLHISLEMSKGRTIQRYWQSFFSGAKRDEKQVVRYFENKENGVVKEITTREVSPRFTFEDIDLEDKLRKKVSMLKHDNLIIQDFPTGQLSMHDLYIYLDGLETFHNFKPDVLVIDYPDLMKMPSGMELRMALRQTYIDLRGLAKERDMALIAPCQVNRAGDGVTQLITRKFMGEDYSKITTCDMHITYNQTDEERAKGFARLYIDKNRNDESGGLILISQNYATGQFCLSSTLFDNTYDPATGEINLNRDRD